MKRLRLPAAFLALLLTAAALRPPGQYPSEVSRVLATYTPAAVESGSPEAMAGAARRFLDALSDERRAEATFPLGSEARGEWTNLPPRAEEPGVRLGDLSPKELERACDLLAAVQSKDGYARIRDILLADDQLLRGGQPRVGFGAENFWLLVFGEPSADGAWALQLDGHHLGLNLAFEGGRMTMAPSFIGTQPSRYERNGETVVPMRDASDRAFALMDSLKDDQKAEAIRNDERGRIAAGPGRDGHTPKKTGVSASTFDARQRALLLELIEAYVGDLPERAAKERMRAIEAELEQTVFAWSGPTANPSDVSYRVQGPSLIIEYACQDLGGDPLDHLHSIYRDPGNEYGGSFAR